jgi:hypothetical protein
MGFFMKEHDVYVGTMLDELSLRFAPAHGAKEHFGGIDEMVELQKEFEIFKKGRSLRTSATALHLGGSINHEVKNRFYRYLGNLRRQKSNVKGMNGEEAIVDALIRNLAAKKPLPVYFDYHDMRGEGDAKGVIVKEKARPLFYMEQDYLYVSLPAQPRSVDEAAGKKPAAKKPGSKAAKKPAKKK